MEFYYDTLDLEDDEEISQMAHQENIFT